MDTLLEKVVLLLALVGVWSLTPARLWSARLITVRPNGHNANMPILNDAIPNGIVTIKTKQINAATVYPIASQKPASTNQMMFSSRRTVRGAAEGRRSARILRVSP